MTPAWQIYAHLATWAEDAEEDGEGEPNYSADLAAMGFTVRQAGQ